MKILEASEVDINNTINSTINSGSLGVIVNDKNQYELVYFSECHYYGSNGGISNTFQYKRFNKNGVLKSTEKSHMYKNIYALTNDAKQKYKLKISIEK